jgi:hypothetical protein
MGIREPLRQKSKVGRSQVSAVTSVPAPVGGWNRRDAEADMPPTDAIALQNWFPKTSCVEIRGGYANHATGMANNGKTLATYNSLTGANKMFCATQSGVHDVSSAGVVASVVAVSTNGKQQWINFGDGTNNYLIMVNGVDRPLYFDGTTWTAVDGGTSPALTGLTTTKIIGVNAFKGRLFFIEKDSLSFWYLAAGAAGGALTEFPLDGEAGRGGYLVAMATWTIDGGDGPEDRAVFMTSEGEAIVYEGNNPGSATAWSKVGVYFLGKPLGRRCFVQYGGDLVLLTQNGAFPLAAALQSAAIDYKLALSFKIENAFNDAARTYGSVYGWGAYVFPSQSALIVNIPKAEDGEHEQYVMNTITKAWCNFTEWDAEDFTVYNGELYFTVGTKVVKAWHGQIDGVNDIVAYGKTAFSYFGRKGLQKQFKMFRPVLAVNGNLDFLTDIDVDFSDSPITGTATYSVVSSALWGVALWGVSSWASGMEVVKAWTSPDEFPGYCAAGKVKIATNTLTVRWMANDFIYEYGGSL